MSVEIFMGPQLKVDDRGAAYIPESDSWMYAQSKSGRCDKSQMDLLTGIQQQKHLCVQLVDRIKKGEPCDIPLSMENLFLSINAFKRDIDLVKSVDAAKVKAHLAPLVESLVKTESGSDIKPSIAEQLVTHLECQYSLIPIISSERKLEVLQKEMQDLKRNLMLAVTIGVVAIACAKLYFG